MTPDRYSRQLALAHWGEAGQRALGAARVLLVGVGGLGNAAAAYLASAGLGRLVLNDFDTVDESNLARQPLFAPADVTRPKVEAAATALRTQNPDCQVTTVARRVDPAGLQQLLRDCDVVVDGSDNLGTRLAVNAAALAARIPLVSGAVVRYEGQLGVFRGYLADEPCYRCLHDERAEALGDCEGQGVLAPLAGLVGAAMALETMKIIVGFGTPTARRVAVVDAASLRWRDLVLDKDPDCPACSGV